MINSGLHYSQTVSELFDLQQFAIKLGLDNIQALTEYLSQPQKCYPIIHIAGTNGKGSTSFFISKFLEAMGLKVGLFTSPHLVDFRERITVNGQMIDPDFIIGFWSRVKSLVMDRKATFFDTTTALSFDYFRAQEVGVAVIETGLGGRLDSTNIVDPQMVIITPIHFDHEKQLGNTLSKIAFEKAGIIKNGAPVFCSEQEAEALRIIKEKAGLNGSFFYLPDYIQTQWRSGSINGSKFNLSDSFFKVHYENLYCKQMGDYQLDNIALAYFASRYYLDKSAHSFEADSFKKVLRENIWPGRLQLIQKNPNLIFDVSHNPNGIEKTMKALKKLLGKGRLVILIGLVQDKDYQTITEIIGQNCERLIITEPASHRKLDGNLLLKAFEGRGTKAVLIKDIQKAFESSKKDLDAQDTLLVTGSHYLIGKLLNQEINLT